MARGDAFDFEVLCRVAGEFEDFGGEVFEDGSDVDGSFRCQSRVWLARCGGFGKMECGGWEEGRMGKAGGRDGRGGEEGRPCTFGTNAHLVLGVVLQETLDTAAGEL